MLKIENALLIFVIAIVFASTIFANNRYIESDPRATLLLSESIINKRTIKLDHYGSERLNQYGYAIHKKNNHHYYYFPIGTSIASIPFVLVANGVGLEMIDSESRVQVLIASLTAVITLVLLYRLAMLFLSTNAALVVSSAFWFGTSLSSTGGTALWSHNFAVIFALLAIYLSVKAVKLNTPFSWFLIAIFLFSAYLCRPTMALLSPFVIIFLFTYSRVCAIKSAFSLALLIGLFVTFSIYEFGQIFPDYYLPKRLAGGHFYEALYGNLFSPARGVFVYSSFIVLAWLCVRYSKKSWELKMSWLLIGLAWPVLHLLFISRFPHWWGGHIYGSRLMLDVIPGLFLLTLFAWPTEFKKFMAKVSSGILFVFCVLSALINTGQGLFNPYAKIWSGSPDIDQHPEYLFDWSYPQFLANEEGHTARLIKHETRK